MGIHIKRIAISSINIPRMKKLSCMKMSIIQGLTLNPIIIDFIIDVAPNPVYTLLKTSAPIMIHAVKPDRLRVAMVVFFISSHVSFLRIAAQTSDPKAPRAAASVGDVIPENMHPSTSMMSMLGRINACAATIFSFHEALASCGRAGPRVGFKWHRMPIYMMYIVASMKPGIMPPAKILPTDTPDKKPYIIIIMLGGIRNPNAPPA
jgi:hypothetical protein